MSSLLIHDADKKTFIVHPTGAETVDLIDANGVAYPVRLSSTDLIGLMQRGEVALSLEAPTGTSAPQYGTPADTADAEMLRKQLGFPDDDQLAKLTTRWVLSYDEPVLHLRTLTQDERNQIRAYNSLPPVEAGKALADKQKRGAAKAKKPAPAPSHSNHTDAEQALIERQLQRTKDRKANRAHGRGSTRGGAARDTPEMVAARNEKRDKTYATLSDDAIESGNWWDA